MANLTKNTCDVVDDFIARHEEWIKRELPDCGYGVYGPDKVGGEFRLYLIPKGVTNSINEKIEDLRQMALKEGIELYVRETDGVRARQTTATRGENDEEKLQSH